MTATRWVYVYGVGDQWASESDSQIRVIVPREELKPYQNAHFSIQSSFSGPALLTFERGRVIRAIPITLTAPLTEVSAQIIPEDAPNVYVTVNAWQPLGSGVIGYVYALTVYNGQLIAGGGFSTVTVQAPGRGSPEGMRAVSVVRFIECPANGGMEWRGAQLERCQYVRGMISCSEWTGVPLRLVLEKSGVKPETKEILFEGLDSGREADRGEKVPSY